MTMPARRMPRGSIELSSPPRSTLESSVSPVSEGGQQGDGGGDLESVGEEQRGEGDERGGHEGDGDRVGAVEDGGQGEAGDHDQAESESGDRADASPPPEGEHGADEKRDEDDHRPAAPVVLERELHVAVGGFVGDDDDAVTDVERAGGALFDGAELTFEGAVEHLEADQSAVLAGVVVAGDELVGDHGGRDRIGVEQQWVFEVAVT
jgi:hypothetical protein